MAKSKASDLEKAVAGDGGMEKHHSNSQLHVHIALFTCQSLSAIYYLVTQVALANGASAMVLSFYRDLLAMIVLIPVAFFVDKGRRLPLTWKVLPQIMMLGFTGIFASNYLLFLGIQFTSAAFSSGLQPAAPVVTAFIAICFGVEHVCWNRRHGQAKVIATAICCFGALLMTFWYGPPVFENVYTMEEESIHMFGRTLYVTSDVAVKDMIPGWRPSPWHIGTLCLVGNTISMGVFLNLQASFLKKFPSPTSMLCYAYAFGAFFMGVICLLYVKDTRKYAIGWDLTTAVAIYNGVIGSALAFFLTSWSIAQTGPLLVASYFNLQPPLTTVFSVLFLGSTLYLGSIFGTVIVVSGLILATWARAREHSRKALDTCTSHVHSIKEPLLKGSPGPALQASTEDVCCS